MEMISTVHLFPGLHASLLALLRGLSPGQWRQSTVCRGWVVQDIVAHILDAHVRLLSFGRDQMAQTAPATPIVDYAGLVTYLNDLNSTWVGAMHRTSPRLLIEFLALVGPQLADHFTALEPDAPALFAVSWAGDTVSPNWFDIARTYTEFWHHQQQIRDAVDAAPLTARESLNPVLAIFMQALPHRYRSTAAPSGTVIEVVITGDAGDRWSLIRHDSWELLTDQAPGDPAARITLSDDTAWRIFTKGLTADAAAARVEISGNRELGRVFLGTLAVMA